MPPKSRTTVAKHLKTLQTLRRDFTPSARKQKLTALRGLSRMTITGARQLITYHDMLCFLRAYPDSADIFRLAAFELQSFSRRVALYRNRTRDKQAEKLADTGIVDTITTHLYSSEMTRLLLEWHPNALALDWEEDDEDAANGVFEALSLLVAWQENDTIDNDEEFMTREWLQLARAKKQPNDLATISGLFSNSSLSGDVQRHLWDRLDLPIQWDLGTSKASRTLQRLPAGRKFYQTEPLKGRSRDFRAALRQRSSRLKLLSKTDGAKLVRVVNEVLAVRNRELFPVTYANPAEVYVVEPGRGLQVYILGTRMEVRLPLETNYGMLLVRNGLPIGYGIAATLFDRVEIAINVFPAFRAGESSYIIEEVFRAFYRHFGSRVFVVRSTQMGHGEDEALYSGAFWFYFKLGCRAVNQHIRRLADREYKKIQESTNYRVPIRTMKRLSNTDVFLHTDVNRMEDWQELLVMNLGRVVTEYFAKKFNGNRRVGIAESVRNVIKTLKINNVSRWSPDETLALERLAPLVMCIPGLSRWSAEEKTLLGRTIRAKGGTRERSFGQLANQHDRFHKAMERLARE